MAPSTSSTASIIPILSETTHVCTKDVLPTFSTSTRENLDHSPPPVAYTPLQQSPIPATEQSETALHPLHPSNNHPNLRMNYILHPEIRFLIVNPIIEQRKAVKRILRYLQDWASDLDDRRSTSRFHIFLGINLISWKCTNKPRLVDHGDTENYCYVSCAFHKRSSHYLLRQQKFLLPNSQPCDAWLQQAP
ncbi:hypothetical protein PIB30_061150 [Stylosanthes scabra]|uniref:Uncharacterized protein n=1 Tax=Stylosanthes scabra TaxID=79078 RepID=A0ABU6VMG8_9FABA|nr:hypothetical protein [Stylosanthes scabra]